MSANIWIRCHLCGKVEERDAEFMREFGGDLSQYECEECSGYYDEELHQQDEQEG